MIQHNALKRCKDAIAVQDACNPNGVAHTLGEHMAALRSVWPSTQAVQDDEALRLIVFKLADLFHVSGIDLTDYGQISNACYAVIAEAEAEESVNA